MKIFVSAYACEPGLGSEVGVGWHWVLEMSKYFELWVLTRESNHHTIEPWIAEHPQFCGIHFIYYDWPKWARFWKKGMRGVRLYYYLWQFCTNSIVKRTMQENDIKIYHLLTYGNALWPASRYGQRQFFVWGPVSVGVSLPKDFTKHYSFFSRQKERLQRLTTTLLPLNMGFRKRCRHANLILCKTDTTMMYVPQKYQPKCVQFTDVAVEYKDLSIYKLEVDESVVTYMMAGTLVGWRNIDVLIEAFAKAYQQQGNIHLKIIGSGNEEARLRKLIEALGMSQQIEMLGPYEMEDYYRVMASADVIVNPCLREGSVTVSFDAMSFAKPLICFDTGGYTHYFNNEYSRVIKGIKTRKDAIEQLSCEIVFMAKANRSMMGKKAYEKGMGFTWEAKGRSIYMTITNAYIPKDRNHEN